MLSPDQRERIWRVGLAALLHDVGKLAQRAEADPERYRSLENLHLFAHTDERGATSYHHAAYTWQFLAEQAPWLMELGEGGDENVAGWASRHHKPSTVFDWIVAESDRLSAGMDRGHPDEAATGWAQVQTCRLTPLLARVGRETDRPEQWVSPLRPLRTDLTLFPEQMITRTQEEGAQEYGRLFDGFRAAVKTIASGNLPRFFRSFLTCYERFAWCVPAATNNRPCDVSLFEHSRAASAIAAALTAQLLITGGQVTDSMVRDRAERRYLLAIGDLFGIQRFIYTVVTENAARALRGRSFALQLLADAIGSHLLDRIGLPPPNLLYNGGGKLWVLAPAGAEDTLRDAAEEIDLALQEKYGGGLGFALGAVAFSGDDLLQKRIAKRWSEASADLHRRRQRRFSGALPTRYEQIFQPFGKPGEDTLCHVCGRLDADIQTLPEGTRKACPECRELEQLGIVLTRGKCVVRAAGDGWLARIEQYTNRLDGGRARNWYYKMPELLGCGYLVSDIAPGDALRLVEAADVVIALNDFDVDPQGRGALSCLLAGINRARGEGGRTLTFDEMAAQSDGIERLGVLRMDVDGLGDIFARGLSPEERTISRITNLSKALAYFFGGVVSSLVERRDEAWSNKVQIIYSGGDDVFIVGAWSVLPALAYRIRREFGRFTAENPAWGISGGLAILRKRHPIASGAKLAGDLENVAKRYPPRSNGRAKDALAFLGDPLAWEDLAVAAAMASEILALIKSGIDRVPGFQKEPGPAVQLPRGWVHRLAQIAGMYRNADATVRKTGRLTGTELKEAVRRGRWVWNRAYALARATNNRELAARLENLMNALPGKVWARSDGELTGESDLIWLLQPAAVWADCLSRERRS